MCLLNAESNLPSLTWISENCFEFLQSRRYMKWLCCVPLNPCLVCRILTYFRFRISVHLYPTERRAESLSLCLSPGLFLSFPQKNLSLAAHFLCDSFQAFQLWLSLAVFLCLAASRMLQQLQPKGLHFCSDRGLRRVWVFFLSFLTLFVFLLLLFNLHILELSCWTPLPPTAVRHPPPNEDSQSKQETNNVRRQISKCIQRNVLLQRQ